MEISIELKDITKRYINQQVIKEFNYLFSFPNAYAIIGANGSGKSTLLQIISGFLPPSKGDLVFKVNNHIIEEDSIYKLISVCTPYQELIEEFTLTEYLEFHFNFKNKISTVIYDSLIEESGIKKALNKQIKYFSSGMKQRVRLILALGSNTPILLLDEPTSNLDKKGIEWYLKFVNEAKKDRLIIVASNDSTEYSFCNKQIEIN
jgi:ABC-type multidrug transport system ATPase subunit